MSREQPLKNNSNKKGKNFLEETVTVVNMAVVGGLHRRVSFVHVSICDWSLLLNEIGHI